jgi:hypothetical protein
MNSNGQHRVLVLYVTSGPQYERLTTLQHLAAVSRLDESAEVLSYNAIHGAPSWLRRLHFDAVVLHTTLLCQRWTPSFATWKRGVEWVADLPVLKIALPQDEYDHAHVLDEWLDELGASVVCTVLDDRHRADLYPSLSRKAMFYEVLTGYIDEGSARDLRGRMVPPSDRCYDVVYRARKLPYWYGSHSQSKHLIGEMVAARASRHGLSCDISTRPEDAILGDAWLEFLRSGRATIGTESGTSVLDPRGEVQARVRELLVSNPALSFGELCRLMPAGWDDYRFFAVSPRHLEAVATKTAQVLVRGRYSGVLEAGRHYIPVEPDFSNLDEALQQLREPGLADRIAQQAYEDVYESGQWRSRHFTSILGAIIREHAESASGGRGIVYSIGAPFARTHRQIEQRFVASGEFLVRNFRGAAAVLRLLMADRAARRLLLLYLCSGGARRNVSLREALLDFLCIGHLRGAHGSSVREGARFRVELDVDEADHQLTLRSIAARRQPTARAASEEDIARILGGHVWRLTWDHSAVAMRASFPILRFIDAPLPLDAGMRLLPTLSWLARDRPRDVARALAPVLLGDAPR